MPNRRFLHILSAFVSALTIANCSASDSRRSSLLPDPVEGATGSVIAVPYRDVLYASDILDSRVDIYPQNANDPAPIASIIVGIDVPTGMAVDSSQALYVANNESRFIADIPKDQPTTVSVYRKGSAVPVEVYLQDLHHPTDAVVGSDGTVYVANFGDGSVTEFPPGSPTPSLHFQPPSGSAIGLALDAANNLYVSCALSNAVFEFAPGSTQGTNLGLAIGGEPHGMAFDGSGDLLVAVSVAPNSGSLVDVFPPGKTQPSKQISGTFQPFMIAFDRSKRHLYVADFGSGNHDGGVFEFAYPSGRLVFKYARGGASAAYGVALNPPATP